MYVGLIPCCQATGLVAGDTSAAYNTSQSSWYPALLLQLIDEQGINRTPKPLVSIVTSAALRQARGLVTEESMLGSETSEAMMGDRLSSSGFSRGWFDSGLTTPQESDGDFQRKTSRMCPL